MQAYAKEIKSMVIKEAQNDDISGVWDGTWEHSLSESENEKKLEDTIDVIRLKKASDLFEGRGLVPSIGEYEIMGHSAGHIVRFFFSGVGDEENLKGVALLKKSPVNSVMKGFWWQYSRNGNLIGGSVTFVKQK